MASESQKQHKLKICIDNTDAVEEIEEGEVSDSEEEIEDVEIRPKKSVFSSRHESARLEVVQQRPLPSPVGSDEDVLTVDIDDLETFGVTKVVIPLICGFKILLDHTSCKFGVYILT